VNKGIQDQFKLGYFELDQQTQALFSRGIAAILRKPLDKTAVAQAHESGQESLTDTEWLCGGTSVDDPMVEK
jgi:hypothetical protein